MTPLFKPTTDGFGLWANSADNKLTYFIYGQFSERGRHQFMVRINDFTMYFDNDMDARAYCCKRESERLNMQMAQTQRQAMKETV